MRTAVVFAGGPHESIAAGAPVGCGELRADLVVAVDSGLHLAQSFGWQPHLVVGDMDSVDPELLARAAAGGAEIRRHPTDKDATDLELALEVLLGAAIDTVTVVGSDAGRMDHLLGGLLTLAAPRFAGMRIDAWLGGVHLAVVHDERSVTAAAGSVVSIIPVNGPARGVRTSGLRWPLRGEVLESGTSRGLSNEFLDEVAHIALDDGCVVVVVPQEEPRP